MNVPVATSTTTWSVAAVGLEVHVRMTQTLLWLGGSGLDAHIRT